MVSKATTNRGRGLGTEGPPPWGGGAQRGQGARGEGRMQGPGVALLLSAGELVVAHQDSAAWYRQEGGRVCSWLRKSQPPEPRASFPWTWARRSEFQALGTPPWPGSTSAGQDSSDSKYPDCSPASLCCLGRSFQSLTQGAADLRRLGPPHTRALDDAPPQDGSLVLWRGFSKASHHMSRLSNAKIHVERAVKQKKIFMIQGHYPVIRCLLRQRGWVEKKIVHPSGPTLTLPHKDLDSSVVGDSDTTEDEDEDEDDVFQPPQLSDFDGLLEFDDRDEIHALMSRMVRNEIPYFIWTTRRDVLDCRFLSKDQMMNHYARAGSFTTKVGLCLNLRNLPWFDEADADSFFPRCYRLGAEDDKKAFIEDFWLTAARNVLKLVVKSEWKSYSIQAEEEEAPGAKKTVVCQDQRHKGLRCVRGSRSREAAGDKLPKKQEKKPVMVSPEFVDEALCACEEHLSNLAHLDIDKDLEAPLYLSPEGWSLFLQRYYQVVHSVHLCNNSIQKHLENSCHRHPQLPSDNMWSSQKFQAHLQDMGAPNAWSTIIVPGMKTAVIHALQTSQDTVQCRKASFELYGADFVFGEDFQPWLIEINASPTMAPSTSVTAQLCAGVQADTLRVVIDRRLDRNCDTGAFELIYKQPAVEVPQYVGIRLLVEGSTIKKPMVMCHRRTGVRTALPHLLTQRGSGEGKDSGILTHRSAPRKVPGARSLGHTEKPDSTATTSTSGKGKKAHYHFPSLYTKARLPSPHVLRPQGQVLRLQHSKLVGSKALSTTGKALMTLPTAKVLISLPPNPELKQASTILKPRKRLCGSYPGNALWPLPFEVGNLPSTHRKIKAKGKFKARLCDSPKAEVCLMKMLSLPGPLPLINAHQQLGSMGDMRLEKPLFQASLPQSWIQRQIKRNK
ncbi:tubulin monoglycylase TTLL3 isoform X5 [Rousettus aegyptiacus]|uniref:tubulin monoglycylase TTLL3 isoform X5 n=1 Tax=Rousettus aegyptiacus TaxID=9407 RepID=UPI00168CE6A5|nr:tubulin monoglycylase TTLL3 isoform X5 [Rousettus aegyptiacus]